MNIKFNNFLKNLIFLIYGVLLFVLPLPHTIAIRNILFGILLLLLIVKAFPKFKEIFEKVDKFILISLGILTLWMFINASFISHYTSLALKEIWGQWIIPVFYLIIGLIIGYLYSYKTILEIIIIALFIHVLYVDLNELNHYLKTHQIITRLPGLTGGPDKSNYLTNLLLAFLITEIIFRVRKTKQYLSFNNIILGTMFILTILSSVFEGMRNGVVAILFLFISSLVFMFYKNSLISKKLKIFVILSLLGFISIPAYYNFTHDVRWRTFIQTIPIALNTEKNKAWLNSKKYPYPTLPNGQRVSSSNYERIAWFKMGLEEILKNPLGYGYDRNAFKHSLKEDVRFKNEVNVGHSHSALIDLTLGIGIPGLVLWLSFVFYLLYLSISYFKKYISYFAVLLFFNIAGFVTRSVVDSNMRDHMFLTFMLIIGFAFIAMKKEINENNLSSSKEK